MYLNSTEMLHNVMMVKTNIGMHVQLYLLCIMTDPGHEGVHINNHVIMRLMRGLHIIVGFQSVACSMMWVQH